MTRNQKIAIGCGGAGCLGLIVVAAATAALYFYYQRLPETTNRNSRITINSNRSSNTNSANRNSANSDDETAPSSSMSDDDKHKLFQAAGMTYDNPLILRVLRKLGFGSGVGSDYEQFLKDHASWSLRNLQFINSINTPEKARAYVEAHLDD
jgi:hypothetical protein